MDGLLGCWSPSKDSGGGNGPYTGEAAAMDPSPSKRWLHKRSAAPSARLKLKGASAAV